MKKLHAFLLSLLQVGCVAVSEPDTPTCHTVDLDLSLTRISSRLGTETFKLKNNGMCVVAYQSLFTTGKGEPVMYCKVDKADPTYCSDLIVSFAKSLPIRGPLRAFDDVGAVSYLRPGNRALIQVQPRNATHVGVVVVTDDRPSGWVLWFDRND